MVKGSTAKNNVIKALQTAFKSDYIGEYDKKYYVWADDGGERVQIAISLTCPKNPVAAIDSTPSGDFNFENEDNFNKEIHPVHFEPVEITQEEKDTVAALIAKLSL